MTHVRTTLLTTIFCMLLHGATSFGPSALAPSILDSCRGHPSAAFQSLMLGKPDELARRSGSGLTTLSAVLAPPPVPWQSFRVPSLQFPKLAFSLPQLPSLEQESPAVALQHSAELSSEMVQQLYFEKLRASDSKVADQFNSVQGQEHANSAAPSACSNPKSTSGLRLPGIDLSKHLAESKVLGREAELQTASTAEGKGGRGASLQLLESLGLSADDAFCDMCRTLKLMGIVHRLDFTTHEGKVFPDVVLTDPRDNARLVLHLDDDLGSVESKAQTKAASRISRRGKGDASGGKRSKADSEYLLFKRKAMARAGYEVLLMSKGKWLGMERHSDRVALLATVLADKGFW